METVEEKVRFLAAEMLITLSDKLNASQTVVNHVVNALDKIILVVFNLVQVCVWQVLSAANINAGCHLKSRWSELIY